MADQTPYLYILMRTDLASMNAGKAVAQGAHAANMFQTRMNKIKADLERDGMSSEIANAYDQWLADGVPDAGFGTTITLECNGDQLNRIIEDIRKKGFVAGVTHDPTYPLRDGQVTHLIPLDTCGYVFGVRDSLYGAVPEMANLNLMGVCGMVKDAGFHLTPKQVRELLTPSRAL